MKQHPIQTDRHTASLCLRAADSHPVVGQAFRHRAYQLELEALIPPAFR